MNQDSLKIQSIQLCEFTSFELIIIKINMPIPVYPYVKEVTIDFDVPTGEGLKYIQRYFPHTIPKIDRKR